MVNLENPNPNKKIKFKMKVKEKRFYFFLHFSHNIFDIFLCIIHTLCQGYQNFVKCDLIAFALPMETVQVWNFPAIP